MSIRNGEINTFKKEKCDSRIWEIWKVVSDGREVHLELSNKLSHKDSRCLPVLFTFLTFWMLPIQNGIYHPISDAPSRSVGGASKMIRIVTRELSISSHKEPCVSSHKELCVSHFRNSVSPTTSREEVIMASISSLLLWFLPQIIPAGVSSALIFIFILSYFCPYFLFQFLPHITPVFHYHSSKIFFHFPLLRDIRYLTILHIQNVAWCFVKLYLSSSGSLCISSTSGILIISIRS